MPQTTPVEVLTGVNLYCAENPNTAKLLNIEEMGIFTFNKATETYSPGGAQVQVDVATITESFKLSFKFKGMDRQMMGYYNRMLGWHIYGKVKNIDSGEEQQSYCYLRAELNKIEPEAFSHNAPGTNYELSAVRDLRWNIAGQEIAEYSFSRNIFKLNGIDQNKNALLGFV